MSFAQFIVSQLLENDGLVRVCASCQKEFGVPSAPNASHGYCKRHLLDMRQQMINLAKQHGNQQMLRRGYEAIKEIESSPDSDFPPDLSKQRQAQQNASVAQ